MKPLILMTLCAVALAGQTAPDPVVATIDGKDWTKSAFDALIRTLPPKLKQSYDHDKAGWLQQYALMTRLAALAKQEGLDQQEPYKQQLEYNNLMYLAQSMLNVKGTNPAVSSADMKTWFDNNKSQYKRARVRGILVSWGQIPKEGKVSRTDTEAAAIIDDVVKRAKAGESFADLAKQYSEDLSTKDKGGEFPLIKPEDKGINESIKAVVFTIKPGELSKAVRLPGGIYVFKLEELVDPTMESLNDEIITQIGRAQSIQWIETVRKETKAEIKDPAFFSTPEKK